ncbi:MAG: MBL fold metallo-hydrolase [Acidobacteria bacterium]|nr:MBL fold metallo-hydrolase [Acidobacteriota bacterium]
MLLLALMAATGLCAAAQGARQDKTAKAAGKPGTPLPALAYEGGTKAITRTPVVGTPKREYPEVFVPGEETLADGELRVTVLGSGNPWPTRAQASASVLVEVGNPERDVLVFDLGTGSLANYASLKLPVNKIDKVFITHLHADHMSDILTLSGSFAKVGRADGPVYVWGPSGTEPRLGTKHFCESIEEALAWDTAAGYGPINPDSMRIVGSEFDYSKTQVVYEKNGVKVTAFPVVHCISGAVGYRIDFAGVSLGFSGDTRPCWPLVKACKGVDVLIHECFPPAAALAAASGLSIERATIALNAAHTSPKAAGKVFSLVKPRVAVLWHTLLSPTVVPLLFSELREVYDGPVVQAEDLTVINITREAVVSRQAKVAAQLPPIPGKQRVEFTPTQVPPPEWWKEALIPLD